MDFYTDDWSVYRAFKPMDFHARWFCHCFHDAGSHFIRCMGSANKLKYGPQSWALILSTCMMPVMFPMMSWLSQQLPLELRAQDFTGTKSVNSLSFIMIWIIAPVIGGRVFRWFSGVKGTTQWTTWMKWTNALNLLLLNYMNGAFFLPQCVQSFHSSAVFSLLLGVLTCCSMGFLTRHMDRENIKSNTF